MTAEQFRPHFTTSQEAADERKEEREETLGKNFHQRVHTVEGTTPANPARVKPSKVFLSRPAERGPDHFDLNQVTEQQKRMLSDRSRKGKSCS